MRDGNARHGASKIARDITHQKAPRMRSARRSSASVSWQIPPGVIWVADTTKARTWFNKGGSEFSNRGDGAGTRLWLGAECHPDDEPRPFLQTLL